MPRNQDMNYKAGALLLITTGEYSDYYPHGIFRAVRDFNIKETVALYIEREKPDTEEYSFEFDKLVAWLSREGYVEDVQHTELWLGAYSNLAEELRI